jgi:hypothetical protein
LLTQLAIVTGAPGAAELYFAALSATQPEETLEGFGSRLEQDARLTGSVDWDVIRGSLASLLEFSHEHSADIGKGMLKEMRDVAQITSRYSFLRR